MWAKLPRSVVEYEVAQPRSWRSRGQRSAGYSGLRARIG
jgi:hypothetical protein